MKVTYLQRSLTGSPIRKRIRIKIDFITNLILDELVDFQLPVNEQCLYHPTDLYSLLRYLPEVGDEAVFKWVSNVLDKALDEIGQAVDSGYFSNPNLS